MSANSRFEHLSDIVRAGGNILVECDGCRRRTIISGEWLNRKFFVHRWDTRVSAITQRLRCGQCGARAIEFKATNRKPTIDPWPRSDADWRKLAHRLRD